MLIDLTQTFVDKMMVYPGDEIPKLEQTHIYAKDHFNNFRIETGLHSGTHIDGPMHMTDSNQLISDIDINNLIGNACIIDAADINELNWNEEFREKISGKSIVLFYTGHSKFFGTDEYLKNYPVITTEFAEKLVELKVKMIGIDSLSPDDFPFQVHKILLGNNILIAENLTNLECLFKYKDFEVIAFPIKIKADGAMARVAARVSV